MLGQPLPADEAGDGSTRRSIRPTRSRPSGRSRRCSTAHCLIGVDINPESRVKAVQGPARPELVQNGWRSSWSRSTTRPGVTAELAAESPNAAPVYKQSTSQRRAEDVDPPAEVLQRWMDVAMFNDRPLKQDALGPGARVPDHPALQPRRRQARGEDQLQRRPGDAGPRLPQRRRHPLHSASRP